MKHIDGVTERLIALVVKTEENRESVHQFVKFCLIGAVNSVIDFGIYYILTRHVTFFDVHTYKKYLANVISFLVATTFSFFANRTWTFRRRDRATFGEAARFYSTTGSGLILNSLLLFLQIRVFHMFDLLAKVFATIVTIFWNFLFKKFWVFTPQTTPTGTQAL